MKNLLLLLTLLFCFQLGTQAQDNTTVTKLTNEIKKDLKNRNALLAQSEALHSKLIYRLDGEVPDLTRTIVVTYLLEIANDKKEKADIKQAAYKVLYGADKNPDSN